MGRQPSMVAGRSRADAGQVVFPPRRCDRAWGDAFRFIAVMRSALSVFTCVGLRRVDFREGRAVPEDSSSYELFLAARAASLCVTRTRGRTSSRGAAADRADAFLA
jgi:hypothetical protein